MANNLFPGICWALLWFIVLLAFALWLSSVCAILYIFISVLAVCFPPLKDLESSLLKGVNFSKYCTEKMIRMESC